eukprot:2893031-Rhodomonas_salina.2
MWKNLKEESRQRFDDKAQSVSPTWGMSAVDSWLSCLDRVDAGGSEGRREEGMVDNGDEGAMLCERWAEEEATGKVRGGKERSREQRGAVSYTHLTLPTICSV